MDDLRRQVREAQRRLIAQQLLTAVIWSVSVALAVAALGILLRKVWALPVEGQTWFWSWIAGAVGLGLLTAGLSTWLRRRGPLEAAVELDRRFGLKERVSSCLALTENELNTEAGQALLDDASRRVVQVDVADGFRVAAGRWAWLPLALTAVVCGLLFLPDAQPSAPAAAPTATVSTSRQVQNSTQNLKKKLQQQRENAVQKGLEDAGDLFQKLEQGMDELGKKDAVDQQKALVKLNDVMQEIKQRQQRLGNQNELRQQLNQLKDVRQGPAERMAQAMKEGDFRAALSEVNKLAEQLRKDELTADEKQKLQQQLEQVRDKLQQLAEGQSQAKRDLEEQIQKKLSQDDRQAAGQLQQQLDKLARQDQQTERLSQLAQQLSQSAQSLKNGQAQEAAQQLADMAEGLEQLQQEMDELDLLEDALNEITDAKDAMACKTCSGMG